MADTPTDLEHIERKLRKDRGTWNLLVAFGLDPMVEWARCSPSGRIGRWFRLNDGSLFKVEKYDAEWGLITGHKSCPGLPAHSGEVIYRPSAWLKANLAPALLPEDFAPEAMVLSSQA